MLQNTYFNIHRLVRPSKIFVTTNYFFVTIFINLIYVIENQGFIIEIFNVSNVTNFSKQN